MSKIKIATTIFSMILILSIAIPVFLIPTATAHSPPWQIPTYAYLVAEPNPVGVGQSITVYMWVDPLYGGAGGSTTTSGTNGSTSSQALLSNNYRFYGYVLTIKAPDGNTTTQTFDVIQSPDSAQGTTFTPSQTGTYTLNFTYKGQVYGQTATDILVHHCLMIHIY